jgi:hypothetical protein
MHTSKRILNHGEHGGKPKTRKNMGELKAGPVPN